MSLPFIGEIRIVGFNFAPRGWANCDGQLLPISQNEALFSLLGTTYGGDGQTTFALPDFRSRIGVGQGNGVVMGERAGVEALTLTVQQIPSHSHTMGASSGYGNSGDPQSGVYSQLAFASKSDSLFADPSNAQASPNMIAPGGGSQPHNNLQPYLCVRFVIALEGIYPSQ